MKLLLDTHAAIWALDCPDRLSRRGRQLIGDPANEVLISSIAPWEIAIKINSGKMPPHVLVTDFLRVLGEEELTSFRFTPSTPSAPGCCPTITTIPLTVSSRRKRWN